MAQQTSNSTQTALSASIAIEACTLTELFVAHNLSTDEVGYDSAAKVLICSSPFLADKVQKALNREGGRLWLEATKYRGHQSGAYLAVHFGARPAKAKAA